MARSVVVTLSANVGNLIAGMNAAARATEQAAGRMMQSAGRNSAEWNTVGSTLTRVGAVAAAGLGLSAKAAMDWESAWAGVRKTVDQTSPAFATLEGDLRGMARTMATSHTEIAAVAESAGALGVATEDVAGFTRTMIMLGETTNLSAGDAADSLAQFMNVMGTAPDMVDNLGSALVALGNDGASTERQIVEMGQRIAAAGRQIGMNEAEVMGFASALASVGIEAEAGGTAISTSFLKMEQAVRNGGTQLETFAEVAGMSTAQFKTAFENDAAGAVNAFIAGLGRVQEAGGDVTGILRELGITGIREADTLRRLAASGTLLADSLSTSATAMAEGTALMEEYGVRAETTESKVRVAWNQIKDGAISAGQSMLPVIGQIAQVVGTIAEAFGRLPGPVLSAGAALTAIVAAVGLGGGAFMKAVVGVTEFQSALATIAGTSTRTAGALRALTTAGLGLAAIAGVIAIFAAIDNSMKEATVTSETLANALVAMNGNAAQSAQGIAALEAELRKVSAGRNEGSLEGLADAMERVSNPGWANGVNRFFHELGVGTDLTIEAQNAMAGLDQSLKQMDTTAAAQSFAEIAAKAKEWGYSSEQLMAMFPQYTAGVMQMARDHGYVAQSADEWVAIMSGQIPPALRAVMESTEGGRQALEDLGQSAEAAGSAARQMASDLLASANAMLQLSGSQMGLEAAIDAATEAIQENGKTLDIGTEKGRANRQALDNIAGSALRLAQAQAEAGASADEIAKTMERGREEFVKAQTAITGNREEAERLADAYGLIPGSVAGLGGVSGTMSEVATATLTTADAASTLAGSLAALPADKFINVDIPGIGEREVQVKDLAWAVQDLPDDKQVTVTMPGGQEILMTAGEVRAGIDQIPTFKQAVLAVEAAAGKNEITSFQTMVDSTTGKTVIVGTISDPSGQRQTQIAVDSTTGKTVWVRTIGDTSGAAAAEAAVARVHNRTVYITTVHRTIGVSRTDRFGGITRDADGGLISPYSGPTPAAFAGAQRLSVGGTVAGWSPHPRADNVPVWATAGEVMMSNWAGDRYGRDRLLAINSGRIDPRAFDAFMSAQGFADGGLLRPQRPSTQAYAAAPVGSMGGVVHNTSITIHNPVTRSWAESVRQESALAAVGR